MFYDVELGKAKATSDNNTDDLDSINAVLIVKKEVLQYKVKIVLIRLERI